MTTPATEHPEIPAVPAQGEAVPDRSLTPGQQTVVDTVNQRYAEMDRRRSEEIARIEATYGPIANDLREFKDKVRANFDEEAKAVAGLEISLKSIDRRLAAEDTPLDELDEELPILNQLIANPNRRDDPRNKPDYRTAVNAWLRCRDGQMPADEHMDILRAGAEWYVKALDDLGAVNTITHNWGPSGGFFARPAFEAAIDRQLIEVSPTRAYATVRPVPAFSYVGYLRTTNLDAIARLSETGTRTESTNQARWIKYIINLTEAHEYVAISYEAQQIAGMDLERELIDDAGIGLGQDEGTKTTTGSGSGEPEGFMTNSLVPSLTSSAVGTIDTGDALRLMVEADSAGAYLNSAHMRAGMYAVSQSALAVLMLEENGIGERVWKPSTVAGQPSLLHGRPWDLWPDMDAVATAGYPLAYANFARFYRMAVKPGLWIVRKEEPPVSQIYIARWIGGRVWDFESGRKLLVG